MTGEDIGFHTQYPEVPLSVCFFFGISVQPNTCSDINTALSINSTIEIKRNKTVQDKVTLLSDLRDSSSRTAAIMCRAANVARYYCDNRAGNHRHDPNQYWDACDQHPNPALRNLRYLETPQEPPCYDTLNPPLPDDVCPDHRRRYGDRRANRIQSHITHLLALVFAAGRGRPLATGAPNIREHIFYDVERYSRYLNERPEPDERYTRYGNHPRHPIRPYSLEPRQVHVFNYSSELQDLEGFWIPEDIARERGRAHIRMNVMNRLIFQLFRAKIDYQEAWAHVNGPLPPEL
ncbi:hypothetical protein BHYA_0374g00060 [Botrytis hyacinthi]|uniref:Uncharacterized protein n=1 Tax=Botrytis hyacinthi TaxID=278943 RepID=A0A4Z1GCJ7_9HELO|nr:hypothetical protein BHYA_0374g00060 [Botrytis hyacinthi]